MTKPFFLDEKRSPSVYLDHAAATPVLPEVLATMQPYWSEQFGNPNSLHQWGRVAHQAVEESRAQLAEILGTKTPKDIIFTASATESNNIALMGVMRSVRAHNPQHNHLITTQIEHDSNLQVAKALEKEGFQVTYLTPDKFGLISAESLKQAIIPNQTVLFSVVHGHYQFGTLQDLSQLAQVCHQQQILIHTDASQSFATQNIQVERDQIDLLTATSAKIYGPKGVALLYVSHKIQPPPQPLIFGGGQERGLRSSTLDVPLIVGFARATSLASQTAKKENARLTKLRDYFIDQVLTQIPHVTLNGHPTQRLPNNVHFSVAGVEGESLLLALDQAQIAASTGSACSSQNLQPDHSLLALGLGPASAHGSLRFTLGHSNNQKQIDYTVQKLKEITAHFRQLSPLSIKTNQ